MSDGARAHRRPRSAISVARHPNEGAGCRAFILPDGSVLALDGRHASVLDPNTPERPEWWERRRSHAIRLLRCHDRLCLEFQSVPTAAQLFTIAQEARPRIAFDLIHPVHRYLCEGGELAMADVAQLEDIARAIFTRWGIAT